MEIKTVNYLNVEAFKIAMEQLENGEAYYFGDRNHKYIPDDKTRFIIWNLPCKLTCVGMCDGCEADCYAAKAEKQYPDALPCRYRNLILSFNDNFVDDVVQETKKKIFNKRSKYWKVLQNGGKIIFRIHESGDFYNLEYLKKWIEIARQLPMVTFLWYTKSFELFAQLDLEKVPANFREGANFSVWEDMPESRKKLAYALMEKWRARVYTALWETTADALEHGCTESLENTSRKYRRCNCNNCMTKCRKCLHGTGETIVAIH